MTTKFAITVLVHVDTDEPDDESAFCGYIPYARDLTLQTPYVGAFYRAMQCATSWTKTLEDVFLAFGVVNALTRASGAGPQKKAQRAAA